MRKPQTGDKSPGPHEKVSTTAHLLNTTGHHLAHVQRHLEALKKSKTPQQKALNQDHAMIHLKGGIEHVQKVMNHLKSNYPAEGKELAKLETTIPSIYDLATKVSNAHKRNK